MITWIVQDCKIADYNISYKNKFLSISGTIDKIILNNQLKDQ